MVQDTMDPANYVVPIIWSSDATNVTFSGSKTAHNVFISIGSISENVRMRNDWCVLIHR
jgi:hypothetical protein